MDQRLSSRRRRPGGEPDLSGKSPTQAGADDLSGFITARTCRGSISGWKKAGKVLSFVNSVKALPHQVLIALDETTAQVAVDFAKRYKQRGADAVYAAVAFRFGATLVTRDKEQLRRLKGAIQVYLPEEAP